MNKVIIVFITLLSLSMSSQDVGIGISSKGFQKALKASLTNLLGTKKILSLDKEQVKFGVNLGILNKEKVAKTDFLLVYGKHMLNINFDEAFRLGFVLSGLNANIEIKNVDLNLGKSQEISSGVLIPISGTIDLKNIGIDINKVELDKATLTDKNVSKQRLLIKKLHDLGSIETFSVEEKLELKKSLQIDACIKKDFKSSRNHINVVSGNHNVEIQNLKLRFQANAQIIYKDKAGLVTFQNFKIEDNLTTENYNKHMKVDFNTTGFKLYENKAVTDSGDSSLKVNCYNLKNTQTGMRQKLISGMLIPKVQEVLSVQVADLLEQKAYPELLKSVEKKEISFKRAFDIKFSPKKSIEKEGKEIENLLSQSFNELVMNPKINKMNTNANNVFIGLENVIEIDDKRITCDYSNEENSENCERFSSSPIASEFKTDSQVSFNGTLLTSVINKFDDLLLNHYSGKVDLLNDEEGRPLLTLRNHDLLVSPVSENIIDISLLLNIETNSLKKILKLALFNKFKIKKTYWGFKNKFCKLVTRVHWINAYLLPTCIDEAPEFEESEDLELALDFRLELKENKGEYKFNIYLPNAEDIFKSRYSETNFEDFYVLKLVRNLLNEKDISIDLKSKLPFGKITIFKFPGLYKKVLNKIEDKTKLKFSYLDKTPYITVPIDLSKVNEKSPVVIKKIHLDKVGHFHFDLDFTKKIFNKVPLKNEVRIK